MSEIKPTAWLCKDYPPFLPKGQWAWRLTMEEPINGLGEPLIKLSEHQEEVDRLRAEAKGLSQSLSDALECERDYLREISELRAEAYANQADAERWRHTRQQHGVTVSIEESDDDGDKQFVSGHSPEELDAAIDNAMEASE